MILLRLFICSLLGVAFVALRAGESTSIPLGPIGGTGVITTGKAEVRITALLPSGPGIKFGLHVNDEVIGAFGQAFGKTPKEGYLGATQDLALAIERAESTDGKLPLMVLRPGKKEISIEVKLPAIGAYGPTYPLGSKKFAVTYEYACQKIAARIKEKGVDQGFNGGWFGLALLGHPKWNTIYARPLVSLRDTALKLFAPNGDKKAFCYAPVEDLLLDGKTKNPNFEKNSGGPGNWDLGAWTMFLAEYRRKTKDARVDAALQRAAEMCANRIQWWKQPPLNKNGYSPEFKDIAGMVSHGGVIGDYIHSGWGGGINMTGVHIFSALALAKQAGVKMNATPKDGHYFGFPEAPKGAVPAGLEKKDFSISEKFDMQWKWLVRCSGKEGAVAYTTGQGGSPGDASGRTSATLFAILASGRPLDANDEKRVEKLKSYITTEYDRLMESHAYTHGGQCFYQLALPFLDERSQRYIMDNWRLFYVLSRQPDGKCAYFGGRGNNGGDGYLNNDAVMETVWALTGSVAYGELPYIMAMPARNKDRVFIRFTAPYVTWPSLDTRATTVVGLSQEFQIEVYDAKGALLRANQYKAVWSKLKGEPGFTGTKNEAATMVTFPKPGSYQILLTVEHGTYTAKEPITVNVLAPTESRSVSPFVSPSMAGQRSEQLLPATQPSDVEVELGGEATLSVNALGRGPINYTWRLNGTPLHPQQNAETLSLSNIGGGQAGIYDCVVTGINGVVTSKPAKLTIHNIGAIEAGGLWCEKFTDPSFAGCNSLEQFLAHARFPRWSDASIVLSVGAETEFIHNKHGQRLTGWIVPKQSALYQFFLSGSGQAQINLSTSDDCHNRRPLITFTGSAPARQWSAGARSEPVSLLAGKHYYIEVMHFSLNDKPASLAMTWRPVTNSPGSRKDGPAPADGSPAIPASVFKYRVGGMFDDIQVTFPADAGTSTTGSNSK